MLALRLTTAFAAVAAATGLTATSGWVARPSHLAHSPLATARPVPRRVGYAHPALTTMMAKAKKGGGKAKAKAKAKTSSAGGGGFGAAKPTAVTTTGSKAHDLITAKRKAVRAQPMRAAGWVELGAHLMKQGEYAEAERAFAFGAAKAEEDGMPPTQPGKEMLDAALLTLRGHSQIYYGGLGSPSTPPPAPPADD